MVWRDEEREWSQYKRNRGQEASIYAVGEGPKPIIIRKHWQGKGREIKTDHTKKYIREYAK
jgi:hypothetical protein